jgi:hypothetical protein
MRRSAMKKNAPSAGKKLSLRVETLRNLNADEMSQVNAGYDSSCWTIVIPSSGITTTILIAQNRC